MPAPRVRSDFDSLANVARTFGKYADSTRQSVGRIKQRTDVLRSGDWIGKGATAFYREMDADVLPTLNRLVRALEAAQRVTNQVSQIMRAAEEEAARHFRADSAGGEPGASGLGAAIGAAVGGVAFGPAGAVVGAVVGAAVAPSLAGYLRDNAKFSAKGDIFEVDFGKSKGSRGGFSPGLGFKYGVDGAAFGDAKASDGFTFFGGGAGAEAKLSAEGPSLGAYLEGYAVRGQGDVLLAGDKDLGLTTGGEVKAVAAEAFAGLKDGTFGASVGGTLVSAKGEVGANIAGYNVGVNAEVGLKAELGFKIGKRTEIKLPFVTLGLSFGGAKD